MAEMRTEEEQIEAIKNWWKKNGTALLIGILAALAIVFGWQAWERHQNTQQAEAAASFNQLLESARQASSQEDRDSVAYMAKELRDSHEDSALAIYAMLLLANQQMMVDNDPASAVESLEWAMSQIDDDATMSLVVRTRLARAQYAAEQYDDALTTVRGAENTGEFESILAELEGDILLASGDRSGAEEAYIRASEAAPEGGGGLMQLKLDDLGIGGEA